MGAPLADESGAVFVSDRGAHYRYASVWDFLGKRHKAEASSDEYKRASRSEVRCVLPPDSVRLWQTIPQDRLIVRLPTDHDEASVETEARVSATPVAHLDALICSLLSGGPEWSNPLPASQFVWSMCMRMARSAPDARRRRQLQFRPDIYTLEGTLQRDKLIDDPLSVGSVLLRAHKATLVSIRPQSATASDVADNMGAELRAYAAIAKTLARKKLPAWYDGYRDGTLLAAPAPAIHTVAERLDFSRPLNLDAMYLAHACYVGDGTGVAKLEYEAEGAENVVFRLAKSKEVLRVRNVPQNPHERLEAGREHGIWTALGGQGVVPQVIATPTVLVGGVPHSAVVMRRFNEKSLDSVMGAIPAVEDTLLELYARLSTVARCVDTKPGNVVLRTFARKGLADGKSLALIDTDGHRCATSSAGAWDAYIGPVSLDDLEYVLELKTATRGPHEADSPLLFAAICLLVFHVAEARKGGTSRYARTRRILIEHFDTVWSMMLAHDQTIKRQSQRASSMVKWYGHLRVGREKTEALTRLTHNNNSPLPAKPNAHDHARDYWCGPDRLIDDLPAEASVSSEAEASPVASKIRELVKRQYPEAAERRVEAHIALAVPRFEAKRRELDWVRRDYDGGDLHAFLVRNKCSVDRLTSEAFVGLLRETEPPLPALYTPDAEERRAAPTDCASAIAALLAPVGDPSAH